MAVINPFPLNIGIKQDSWEKLQLLANIDPSFKLIAEEFNKMIQGLEYLYTLGGGSFQSLPPLQQPYYADVAAMYANQENQTTGFMQKVLDGPGDLLVTYYIYNGGTTGSASDYDQLTEEQAVIFEAASSWHVKKVKGKAASWVGNIDLQNAYCVVTESGGNITSIIFDESYSNYLAKAIALKTAGESVYFSIANVTQEKHIVAEVSSFGTYEATTKVIANLVTTGNFAVATADIVIEDSLHLFLPLVGGGSGSGTVVSGAESVIFITQASEIVNQVLDSSKIYQIDGSINLAAGEYIIVPSGGLTLFGYGFDVSNISKNTTNESIFSSPAGGSGNLVSNFIQFNAGVGSIFNLEDSDGSHAIELNDINFIGSASLGEINGYRQFLGTTLGIYSCSDGLTLSGTWTGFRLSNSNIFGFGSSGTLIKQGTSLSFSNRVFLNVNIDFPTGAVLSDLQPSNFTLDELFQINGSQVKLNSVINQNNADALLPNISANDKECLWTSNIGLPTSSTERFIDTLDAGASHVIDWLYDTHQINMTEDCVLTESNLPPNGLKTGQITIYLEPNNFNVTLPSGWTNPSSSLIGTIKQNEINEIVAKFLGTNKYFIKVNNSLSVYPAPNLSSVNPLSLVPSQTQSLSLLGSFFTPATIVEIENQTVTNVEFISSGELLLTVSTGATESDFDIIISNGTEVTFSNALIVNLGVVYVPSPANWVNQSGALDVSSIGQMKATNLGSLGGAEWNQVIDINKDFYIRFNISKSALGWVNHSENTAFIWFNLKRITDDVSVMQLRSRTAIGSTYYTIDRSSIAMPFTAVEYVTGANQESAFDNLSLKNFEIRFVSGLMTIWVDGVLDTTFTDTFNTNLYLDLDVKHWDVINIKYIELP
jgi:hypothetical protein